ncbi:hypothetical protein LTR17_000836 [Elasticomyces elasticus]|nr:hypothetical protein LTR17_000836 [Elasticomyces elasticus]
MASPVKTSTLFILPNELLLDIAERLNNQDLWELSRTSRKLRSFVHTHEDVLINTDRICKQVEALDLSGLDIVPALYQFAAAHGGISPVPSEGVLSLFFATLWQQCNQANTRWTAEDLDTIAWLSMPYEKEYLSRAWRTEPAHAKAVRDAKSCVPFWPKEVVFDKYLWTTYTPLPKVTIKCLQLPILPLDSSMIYVFRESKGLQRLKEVAQTRSPRWKVLRYSRFFVKAKFVELVRILPAELFPFEES